MAFFDTTHRYEIIDTETGAVVEKGFGGIRAAKRIVKLSREYHDGCRAHTSNLMPGAPYAVIIDGAPEDKWMPLSHIIDDAR